MRMYRPYKILTGVLLLLGLTLISICGRGQSKTKLANKKHGITIGFQSGREVLQNQSSLFNNKQSKMLYGINHNLVLRKAIKPHFKFETGVTYSEFQNQAFIQKNRSNHTLKPYSLSLPATLQYFFLPEKCRLHPYCGAGLQYNLNIASNTISPFSGDAPSATSVVGSENGTKYISILFTQGITYEINTKIQVTQSFHFIPSNNNKTFGIDLGVGYTIP